MRGVNKRSAWAAQDEVKAAPTAVAPAGAANRRDHVRVPRSGKPIVDGRPDLAALDWRIAGPVMASDEQYDPLAMVNRLLERSIDGAPGGVEAHSV